MNSMNDHELLQRYAESRCEASFTELVKRYVDLVHSAALRQVGGDAHLAHDVTQSVFIDLARKAGSLSVRTVLAGWLYTSAHYAAAKVVRTEQRWRAREQEANSMREILDEPAEPSWEELRSVIDEAMHELNQGERDAVLLRFFEKRQLGEVGAKLGVSEDAARKRVDRALDKLRGLLARRGVTSTSAALVLVLGANTVAAAPAGMAATIAGAAIAGTAAGTGGTLTILKLMAMSKLKVGLISAVVVAGVATPLVIQNHTQAKLRAENQDLRQQNTQLAEQMTPLVTENARLSNLIAQTTGGRPVQESQSNELLKLRGEVARLRQDARGARSRTPGASDPVDASMQAAIESLAARATKLRQRLEQAPERKIPELKFLTEKDWLNTAGDVEKLESDEDFSRAMSDVRARAKSVFGEKIRKSLRRYAEANGDMLPSDITQLQSYFGEAVDIATLQRYQIATSGSLADVGRNTILIKEIAPRVDDFDSHYEFSLNGTTSRSGSMIGDALEAAATEYANANGGFLPRTPEQLATYLQQPVDPIRVQKFLAEVPPNVTTLEQLKGKR
jgi:RNA polymerase sigma factor (sigma-70 family)